MLNSGAEATRRNAVLVLGLLALGCGSDAGPQGETVDLSFCAYEVPVWLAVQDGDGPWTRLAPISEGRYEATFTTGRGGVAYMGDGGYGLVVNYGVTAELGTIACNLGFKQVNGNVQAAESAEVALGSAVAYTDGDNRFRLSGVADGPQDLLAARYDLELSPLADRFILLRDQDVPAFGTLPLVDFSTAEAFAPATVSVSVPNLNVVQAATLISGFYGERGPVAATLTLSEALVSGPVSVLMIPAERLQPGEFNLIDVDAWDDGGGQREAVVFVAAPTDLGITLGPVLNTPVVTRPQGLPSFAPRVQLASQPEYGRMAYAEFSQEMKQSMVTVTSAYVGGTPATWLLQLPDFSGVDGWNTGWNLAEDEGLGWRVTAEGGVNPAFGDVVVAGSQSVSGVMYGYSDASVRAFKSSGPPEPYRWGFPKLPPRPAP